MSSIPAHITGSTVQSLLPKLTDPDADFRFMSLNDLHDVLQRGPSGFLIQEYAISAKTVDGILKTLDDQNGEVQNLAIKCLSPLVQKVSADIWPPLIEKVSMLKMENSVDRSVPSTALRAIVTSLPRPVPGTIPNEQVTRAYDSISKVLIVRLVGRIIIPLGKRVLPQPPKGMLQMSGTNGGVDSDALDLLIEVIRCFGTMLQGVEIEALQGTIMEILENERMSSVVKKKAVTAYSVVAAYFTDDVLSASISQIIESFRDSHLTPTKRRLLITLLASMAKSIPRRFGPYLQVLAPFVFSASSEEELQEQLEKVAEDGEPDIELDEVRESALVALESFLASCSSDMRPNTLETVDAAVRFLQYDPNNANAVDESMEAADSDEDDNAGYEDEDYEEDEGFSDDDDMTWKVRRCAAKLLYTLISTRANDLLDDGTLYGKVAPQLVERFREREDNVLLEVISAMSLLVRKTGEGVNVNLRNVTAQASSPIMGPPHSRKRRRLGSDASMLDAQLPIMSVPEIVTDPPHASGSQASLAALTPSLVQAAARVLKGKSILTKEAAISLLKDLLVVQHGGLTDYLAQIIDPVVDAIRGPTSSGGQGTMSGASGIVSSTGSVLRIQALQLLESIADTHPSSVLHTFLPKIIQAIVLASKDKFYKVSSEGLDAIEAIIKVITPPRWLLPDPLQQAQLGTLYEVVIDRAAANDADLEVRQRAIHALGTLLARTSGTNGKKLLSMEKRTKALDVLQTRLRNEITRVAAVRAINAIALLASAKEDFPGRWVQEISLDLGAQLRKSNRTLRGSSLVTLKDIIINPYGLEHLENQTIRSVVELLLPLLDANDLHLLGHALSILAKLAQVDAGAVANAEVVTRLCNLVQVPLSGGVLDALLMLVKAIGEQGVGQELMAKLLKDVGVAGDPAVVGKVIGTLLVHGGSQIGVKLEDFTAELETVTDEQNQCLALSTLGEAGLRLGTASPLKPELFIKHFKTKSDRVPLVAAVALGRAGAGNVAAYLPTIMKTMDTSGVPQSQYLLLHSIKEILQYASDMDTDVAPYAPQIWSKLLETSRAEDNKAVGAECIGRLALIDPKTYLSALQGYLSDSDPAVRGMVIQALRYTLADVDETYDDVLKPILTPILATILQDDALENQRLALTTLNSAAHNKPEIILPNLGRLLPVVMEATYVKLELIREVMMGPFKHKVDDGLDVRKSAYETLYALMETAFTRINVVELFDRVLAGLEDEHDIRVLCNLMLAKLIVLDPEETTRRLDAIAQRFQKILSSKLKENAVKQEVEKSEEASKSVLNVAFSLNEAFPAAASASSAAGTHGDWRSFWEWVRKEFSAQLRFLENQGKDRMG